jgi:hypothetical protein
VGPAFARDASALPVDPSLHRASQIPEPARWGRFVHVRPRGRPQEELEATPAEDGGERLRRVLFGPPIRSSAVVRERMRKIVALPVLSADALSSVAYGPEAIPRRAGAGRRSGARVVAADRRGDRLHDRGGRSLVPADDPRLSARRWVVHRRTENLGQTAGLLAAAGLVTDYVLTVTISTAAGLDAVSSAVPFAPTRRWCRSASG